MKKQITLLALVSALSVNAAQVDWSETFDTREAFSAFTVKDVNEDGKTWEYSSYNKYARAHYGDLQMDDWLITPSFTLEAGVTYKFSIDAKSNMGVEKFEVFAGNAASVEAMTIPVIARQEVRSSKFTTFEGEFTVNTDGTYYIGIHGCSDPDKLYLDIDNLKLKQGASASSPAPVSGLEVIPDMGGLNKVTVRCTLPSVDLSGNSLASIDNVEVLCDDASVATEEGIPGDAFEWTHNDATPGTHKYTVVVSSGGERGQEVSAEVFVGPNKPSAVPYLGVGEFTPGDVTIRWNAPATDIDGKALNPDLLTYKVVRYQVMDGSLYYEEDIEDAEDVTGTEYVHHAIDADAGQMFTAYGVYAKTVAGRSTVAKTPLFPVGTSYAAPWGESFAGGNAATLFRSETVAYEQVAPSWDAWSDETSEVKAFDGDGGFLAMAGASGGDCARYYSGKIDLGELASPALSFYVYNQPGGNPSNNLFEVYVSGGQGFTFEKEFKVGELPAAGWNLVTVPLDEHKGKTVQFAFQLTVSDYVTTLVDNIKISELHPTDLAITGLQAPASVVAGSDFRVVARIENRGSLLAEDYEVDLYDGDRLIETLAGEPVSPDGVVDMVFTENISVFAVNDAEYHAVVRIEGDANESNNTSATCKVNVAAPAHPVPTALSGSVDGNTVTLTWTEPYLEDVTPEPITDDFESYESFATENVGGWTFVDVDGAPIGKFDKIVFPGITVENQSSSFWVNDATLDCLDNLFAAHSGDKYLAQMFTADQTRCDDWAISPELYGSAQTISFYAKSYSSFFHEEMEVLYSTTGTDTADFTSIKKDSDVPNVWTQYEVELPEGAKYFAIRCTSNDCYMLFIDDVTYTPLHGSSAISLVGYNVYRDGVKLNSEPVATPSFTDPDLPAGMHEYTVTALYDKGESLPSETYATQGSGLADIDTAATCRVRGMQGAIEIECSSYSNVAVCGVDGKLLRQFTADGDTRLDAAPGIYLVTVGHRSFKVIVK